VINFGESIAGSLYHKLYQRDGLHNILIQDQLYYFIQQKRPEILEKYLTFAEFIQEKNLVLLDG
jgi:hypothetical protein